MGRACTHRALCSLGFPDRNSSLHIHVSNSGISVIAQQRSIPMDRGGIPLSLNINPSWDFPGAERVILGTQSQIWPVLKTKRAKIHRTASRFALAIHLLY